MMKLAQLHIVLSLAHFFPISRVRRRWTNHKKNRGTVYRKNLLYTDHKNRVQRLFFSLDAGFFVSVAAIILPD